MSAMAADWTGYIVDQSLNVIPQIKAGTIKVYVLIEQIEGHAEVRMVIKAGKAGKIGGKK